MSKHSINFILLSLSFLGFLLLTTCGDDDKKKDTSTGVNTELIPSDWDGQSDYANSALEVQDDS